jgi:hypothetical protein
MDECCAPPPLNLGGSKKQDNAYRLLFAVLAINAAMFAVEVIAGLAAGSTTLQADALDFWVTLPITRSACSLSVWRCTIVPRLPWRRVRRWLALAYGLSGLSSGTLCMERYRARSQWVPWAARRW